jgi:hypothetical protein
LLKVNMFIEFANTIATYVNPHITYIQVTYKSHTSPVSRIYIPQQLIMFINSNLNH